MPPENDGLTPETDNSAPNTTAAATTPAAPASPPTSILTSTDDGQAPKGDWAADWREKMAAGDEKELKRLQRLQSPIDVYKSFREAEKKISSSTGPAKLASDATPEQVAAYRTANGIPEKPADYLAKLPDGLVIGDADRPMLEGYLARVHGKNASPEVVAETLGWYYGEQERIATEQAAADKAYSTQSSDALREEWGGEFRGNINSITAFLDAAPATPDGKPLKELLMNARLGDSTRLGDNPTALKWLAAMAAEANPAGFVSPGEGGSQATSVAAEIATIEKRIATDSRGYYKDEAMQTRYGVLLAARDKLASK